MRVIGYAIIGSEAVLCRIICKIRLKMAENGHVAQLLKQMPKLGIFLSAILCHGDCHTGTGTPYRVFILETRVQRTHIQLLHALDGPKQSLGGRDMTIFCPNVAQMSHCRRKGLNYGRQSLTHVSRPAPAASGH